MESETFESPELLSISTQNAHLGMPHVKRITNIREFMSEMKVDDWNQLRELLFYQEKHCLNIKNLLSNQIKMKLSTLESVKEDMLDLGRQLRAPGASYRFTKGYKVLVKFSDETEINEYKVPQALALYNLKMNTLFNEILMLDSDVDYMGYLQGIATKNKEFAEDWLNKARDFK